MTPTVSTYAPGSNADPLSPAPMPACGEPDGANRADVPAKLQVQVCYAVPGAQMRVDIELPAGATVADAIERSGILARAPEIDLARQRTGIFGRLTGLDERLKAGDRVEIYRPLAVDPKTARQRRVAKSRAGGSREGRRWLNKDSR